MHRLHQEQHVSHGIMILLAVLIGIIAGFAAVVFHHMISLFHNLFFYQQWSFSSHANHFAAASPLGIWLMFVPVGVAIIVAWLVSTFAPEAKGHGVPEVMDAIYYNKAKIRPVVGLIKAIASSLTIGSGGSAGREGPIVQISAAFGSLMGSIVSMPARQRAVLIAAGAAAGIGSVFNTPIGAIAFSIEILMVSISAASLFPVVIATVTATYIGHAFLGVTPPFYVWALTMPHFRIMPPELVLVLFPFGICVGILATIFIRGLYWFEDLFDAVPGNYYIRHIFGMLLMGIMMVLMMRYTGHYYIEGSGYSGILTVLKNLFTDPWFLLFLVGMKMLATFLTIGSGGSGGIFSPSLFLGALFGDAFGLMMRFIFPWFHINPVVFATAGMAGMIGSSTGAVLTGIIIITEMTHDINTVMPIIMTVAIAYATRKVLLNESIYTLKLLRRGHVVPEGLQSAMTMARRASHVMIPAITIVQEYDFDQHRQQYILQAREGMKVIIAHENKIVGVLNQIGVLDTQFIVVASDTRLPVVIQAMESKNIQNVLVAPKSNVVRANQIIGIITEHTILQVTYKTSDLLY